MAGDFRRLRRTAAFACALVAALAATALSTSAATVPWEGDVDSNWFTGGNWTGGSPPASGDTAEFGATGVDTITIGASTSLGELSFLTGAQTYTFGIGSAIFAVTGAGIANASSNAPIFNVTDGGSANTQLAFGTFGSGTSAPTAGDAIINTITGGIVYFYEHSTAGTAVISQDGTGGVNFRNSSSADHATINGFIQFLESSTAGDATINDIVQLNVSGSATLANATVTTSGGQINLTGSAEGGDAVVSIGGSAQLNINASSLAGTTIGSVTGIGVINLGSKYLTVGSAIASNSSVTYSGFIIGTGGAINKAGAGTWVMGSSGAFLYTGATTIDAGTLEVDADASSSSSFTVNDTLSGTGTVSATTVNNGGSINPGQGTTPGTLTVSGTLDFGVNSHALFYMTGSSIAKIAVTGAVDLSNGPALHFDATTPNVGVYEILSAASITGQFNGTVDYGSGFSGLNTSIDYTSDPTKIFLVVTASAPTLEWTGSSSDDWDDAGNWNDTKPGSLQTGLFGATGDQFVYFTTDTTTTVGGLEFDSGADQFEFVLEGGSTAPTKVIIDGAGIINNSSNQPFIDLLTDDEAFPSELVFAGSATAGDASIGFDGPLNIIRFQGNSSAADSEIIPLSADAVSEVHFEDASTAFFALIYANKLFASSTASLDRATINIGEDGLMQLDGASDGGQAEVFLDVGSVLDITGHDPGTVSLGSIDGSGTIRLGAHELRLEPCSCSPHLFDGTIEDYTPGAHGALTMAGEGLQILDAAGTYTYTGQTTVDSGDVELEVDGDISSSSGVVVEAGVLSGYGILPTTAINDGGTISPGGDFIDTLTINGDLTYGGDTTTYVDIDDFPSSDLLAVSGAASLDGVLEVVLDGSSTFTAGMNYTVVTAASVSGGYTLDLIGSLDPGLDIDGGIVGNTYVVQIADAFTWKVNPTDGTFGTGANWFGGAAPGGSSDTAIFGASSITAVNVATQQIAGMTFGNDTNYTLTIGASAIVTFFSTGIVNNSSTAQTFNLTGSGATLDFNSASGSADTIFNVSGQVAAVRFNGTGSAGSSTITVSGTDAYVAFNGDSDAGGASISLAGTRATIVFTAHGQAGSATVTAGNGTIVGISDQTTGTVSIGSLSGGASTVYLGGNTLELGALGLDDTFGGAMEGSGGLTKVGNGKLTLTGASTYTGVTTISGGILSIGTGGSIVSDVVNDEELRFDSSRDVTLAGDISGDGDVRIQNTGVVTLSGTNTYTGQTILRENATLSISSDDNVGSGKILFYPGSTLIFTASGTFDNVGEFEIGAPVFDTGGNTITYSGQLIGGGDLTVVGGGTLILTNTGNLYSGGTFVQDGTTLQIDYDAELGATSGDLNLGDASTSGTLQLGASLNLHIDRALQINAGGGTIDTNGFDMTIVRAIDGAGDLTKTGTGTLTLAGTDSYSHTFQASGGALSVTGTYQSAAVAVGNGGTLSGNGEIGSVQVASGGTLLSAVPLDALTITNDLTFDAGSIYRVAVDAASVNSGNVGVSAGGAVSIAGDLTVDIAGGSYSFGDVYTLLSSTSLTGSFADVTYNGSFGALKRGVISYTSDSVVMTVAEIEYGWAANPPATANWEDSASWESGFIPSSAGVAVFGASTNKNPLISPNGYTGNVNIGEMVFDEGGYTVHVTSDGGQALFNIEGAGITSSLANAPTIALSYGTNTSQIYFANSASAGYAHFDAGYLTLVRFGYSSTAADATINVGQQASLSFENASTGGNAAVDMTGSNSEFGIDGHDSGTVTIGSLAGVSSANVRLGSNTLEVGSLNTSTTFAGVISDSGGGSLTKVGTGTLTLANANTYSGITTISAGTLKLGDGVGGLDDGSLAGDIQIDSGATLAFNNGGSTTVATEISGAGAINIVSGTDVTFTYDNTSYTGTITIQGSQSLYLGSGGSTGSVGFNSDITGLSTSSALYFNHDAGGSFALGGDISVGILSQVGAGYVTLSGDVEATNFGVIDAGTFIVIGNAGTTGTLDGTFTGGGGIVFDRSDSSVFDGHLGSNLDVQIGLGASGGILTFGAANTYAGFTSITNGATLRAGAANVFSSNSEIQLCACSSVLDLNSFDQHIGGLSGSGLVHLGSAELVVTSNLPTSFGGVIDGTGTLTVAGPEVLTITNAQTYTGGTTIGASGHLRLADGVSTQGGLVGDIANQGVLSVANAGVTVLNGNIVGGGDLFLLADGSTLQLGGTNTYSGDTSIQAGQLQANSAGALSQYSRLVVNNIFGAASVDLNGFASTVGGLSGDGTIILSAKLTTGAMNGFDQFDGTLNSGGGLKLVGGSLVLTGDYDDVGDLETTNPLALGGAGTHTVSGNVLTTGSSGILVGQAEDLIVSGSITGTGRVEIDSGQTTITGTIASTLDTTSVIGGTLRIGDGTTNGDVQTDIFADTVTKVIFNPAAMYTYAHSISGAGGVEVQGPVTFTASQTFNGLTKVTSAGTLILTDNGTTGQGSITVDGTLIADRATDFTIAGTVSGDGTLIKRNSSTLTLSGGFSLVTGGVSVEAGTLVLGDNSGASFQMAGDVLNNGHIDINQPSGLMYDYVISGSGSVTFGASNVGILSKHQTYTGQTTIRNIVSLQGDAQFDGNVVVEDGGALWLQSAISPTVASNIQLNGNAAITAYNDTTLTGTISGTGSFYVLSGAVATLAGSATYSGVTSVSGTLRAGAINAFSAASVVTLNGGSGTLDLGVSEQSVAGLEGTGSIVFTNAILTLGENGADHTAGVDFSGLGSLVKTGTNTQILTGVLGYTGNTTVQGGTLQLDSELITPLAGIIVDAGATLLTKADVEINTLFGGGTLDIGAGTTFTLNYNGFFGGLLQGAGTFVKTGSGAFVMYGDSSVTQFTIAQGEARIGDGATAGTISSAITNNATLSFDRSDTLTVASTIDGSGVLQKLGAGTLVLTGESTYSGGTTVSNGTLQIGDGGTAGSITGNVTVAGTLTFNRSDDVTFGGVISGSGGLTKLGAGNLILTATNTYNGATAVNAGRLSVNGSLASSAVTVNNGGTLGGTGTVGATTVASGGTLAAGNSIGTLTINGNLTLQSGSQTDIEVTSSAIDLISVSGSASLNGNLTLTASGGGFTDGSRAFLTANSVGGTFASYTVVGGFGLYAATIEYDPQNAYLVLTRTGVQWSATPTNHDWNTGANWVGGAIPLAADDAIFGATTISNIDIAQANAVNSMIFDASAPSYSFNIAGVSGASLTVGGVGIQNSAAQAPVFNVGGALGIPVRSGTLEFAGSSSGDADIRVGQSGVLRYTGAANGGTSTVSVNGGSFDISGASNDISIGTLAGTGGEVVLGNNTLETGTVGANTTFAGVISGNGGFVLTAGLQLLTGANTYTGDTTVDAGAILVIGNGGSTGSIAGDVTNDGLLVFARSNNMTFGGTISGTGVVSQQGAATVILTADNSYTGGTEVLFGGALQIGNGGTTGSLGTGDVTVDAGSTLIFNRSDNIVIANTITGTGMLRQEGTGSTYLTANNTYSGGSVVTAGALVLANGTAGNVLGGDVLVQNNALFAVYRSDTLTFTGTISGTGRFSQAANGTTILTADSTFTGGTMVEDGVLQLGNGGTTGSVVGNVADNGLLAFNRSNTLVFGGVISGSGAVSQTGTGTTILTGANTYAGTTTVASGVLQIGDGGTTGSLGSGAVNDNAVLVFNRSDIFSVANNISGTGELRQTGTGTTILTGANSYSGVTTISSGTLQIGNGGTGGSLGSGAVTDNGTLTFNHSDNIVIANTISGTGVLRQEGTGATYLTANNTYSGGSVVTAGALVLANGTAGNLLGGNVDVQNNALFAVYRSDTLTFTGTISGTGRFSQAANGTTILTADSTFTGGTMVEDGVLQLGNGGTTGSVVGNVADNGLLAFNRSNTLVFGGVISGNGAVSQTGTGTTVLTGANTYAGTTTVSSGVLQIGNGGTTGSLGTGAVNDNAVLTFNRSNTTTVANTISGTGELRQTGTGTTILTAANTYSGGTTISAGTLQLGNGGTTGSIVGDVADDGLLAFNRSNTVLFAGAISGTGALSQIGAGTTILTGTNTYVGTTTITSGVLQVGNGGTSGTLGGGAVNDNAVLAFNRTDTLVVANAISGTGALRQDGTGATVLTGTNIYTGGTTISAGVLALGTNGTTGSIVGDVTDNSGLMFRRSDTYVFAGVISGTGQVNQAGGGTTVLTGANSYSGGTFITAGALQIGNGGTTGAIVGDVSNGATLAFNRSDSIAFAGSITGTGALRQNGTGTLTLTGASNYTGGTIIAAGTLQLGNGGTTGSITGDVTDNGVLAFNRSDVVIFGGAIGGTGALTQIGSGTTVLTGTNTYAGTTTISAGQLVIGNAGTTGTLGGGAVINNAALMFNRGDTMTVANAISGTGTVTQTGGITILSGATAYTGATRIMAGTMQAGATNAFSAASAYTVDAGTTLALAGFNQSIGSLSGGGLVGLGSATLTAGGDNSSTLFAGLVTGTGGLIKAGTGTLTLTGNNPYGGGTAINSGTLQLGNGGTTGGVAGAIVDNGTLTINRSDNILFANQVSGTGALRQAGTGMTVLSANNTYTGGTTIVSGILAIGNNGTTGAIVGNVVNSGAFYFNRSDNVTFAGAISGTGSVTKFNGNTLILTGDSTYTGGTTINGTLQLGNGGTTGGIVGDIANNGVLIINRSNTLTLAGVISGLGGLQQAGTGTTFLTGVSTYSGATLITAGILSVNGSIANSIVTVNGGQLKGNGTIGGLVVVGGSTVSPGNSIGTLNVAGNVTFAAGTTYQVEVNPVSGAADLINIGGTATILGGAVQVLPEPGNFALQTTYRIINAAGGVTGTFGAVDFVQQYYTASLLYGITTVDLIIRAKTVDFGPYATTPNQIAVSGAVNASGFTSDLYRAFVNQPTGGFAAALDSLSGEIYPSVRSAMLEDSRTMRQAILDRLRGTSAVDAREMGEDTAVWLHVFNDWGTVDSDGNAAAMSRSHAGVLAGIDTSVAGALRLGLAAGYSHTSASVIARQSKASGGQGHIAGYANWGTGALSLRGGVAYAWGDADVTRTIQFPGFTDNTTATLALHTTQAFGEAAYTMAWGDLMAEPFAGFSWIDAGTGSFNETGGIGALRGDAKDSTATYASLGLRLATAPLGLDMPITPRLTLAWQHAFGSLTPGQVANIASTNQNFAVLGLPLDKDAIAGQLGIDIQVVPNGRLGLGYDGVIGSTARSHAVRADFIWNF